MIQLTQAQFDSLVACKNALDDLCSLKLIKNRIEAADAFERDESQGHQNRVNFYNRNISIAWERAFRARDKARSV